MCDFRFLAGALWGAFSWPCVASLTSRPNRSWTAVVRAVPARQRACSSRSRAHQLRAEAAPSAEACNARSASKATQQVTIQQFRDAARSWQIGIPSCTGPTPARVVATVRVLQRYDGVRCHTGRRAMLREYCATRACARLLTADSCFDIDLTDCCSVFSRCDCLVIRACSCKAHPDAHGYRLPLRSAASAERCSVKSSCTNPVPMVPCVAAAQFAATRTSWPSS